MRILVAIPLLLGTACNVTKDPGNDRTTYEFNEQKVEDAADKAGDKAEAVATDIGNAAEQAGGKIKDKVDDVDIDVNVNKHGK